MPILPVTESDRKDLEFIAFNALQPLYGDQSKTLSEWLTGDGFKKAFLMKDEEGNSKGFVSLKIDPSKDYVKISTFFIFPGFRGTGVGKCLIAWVITYVQNYNTYKYLKVTVSEDKPEALAFFQKHLFQVVEQYEGKYLPGKTEFVLYKELANGPKSS